ncbi:MAG: SurA N-terminal domain-containing protein [Beijerinckiaceae bacterium]|nr:SurA N-terminal domain-containing protein [Beijerinckiaceae bacterium]
MLEGMRRATKNWLGKILVGILFTFLILSFAVWGIGDIFRGFGVGTVAKVGETEILTETYRQAYQSQLQTWQREARRAITNDEARTAGLDRLVLNRLLSEATLDQRIRDLGLAMADRDIAQAIVNDPSFLGPTGRFERQRFNDALREAGFPNEQRFLLDQRMTYLRRELALSLAGDVPVPRVLLEAAHRYGAETRAVEYIVLPESLAGEIPDPSDEALKTFFEQRRTAFRAPEYRSVTFLAVTPASVADPSKISDEDALRTYEAGKARYSTAERRSVQQIVFPSEEDAITARKRIDEGLTFDALAEERKLSATDIDLGTLAWTEFVDPNIAQGAFATPEGQVSQPIKGQFGHALVRVSKIEPLAVRPFKDVATQIKEELATRRAGDQVRDIRDKIEDQRTSGQALTEAAKAVGLTPRLVEVNRSGRDRAGNPAITIGDAEALLRAAYASDIGVDNDLITTRDNGYIWFEVSKVDPARERTLDEVRDQVVETWRSDEAARILQEKASEIVKRIEAGEAIEVVAKDVGLEVQVDQEVRRLIASKLPAPAVTRVFSVRVGAVGSVGNGNERIVFKVNDAVVPAFDPEEQSIRALEPQLRNTLTEDILSQYIARVQDELGISINEAAVRLAVGGGQDGN